MKVDGTMTTADIAYLTGQQHASVMAVAEHIMIAHGLDPTDFLTQYTDDGLDIDIYFLSKPITIALILSLNVSIWRQLMDKWAETEDKPPMELPQVMTAYVDALTHMADYMLGPTNKRPKANILNTNIFYMKGSDPKKTH